jgi:putative membrane protein
MVSFAGMLAHAGDDGGHHMDGWGGGWMWLWGLAMMALFVIFIAWLVRTSAGGFGSSGPPPRDPTDRAREILAERYAKGELSTEEYRERASELQ